VLNAAMHSHVSQDGRIDRHSGQATENRSSAFQTVQPEFIG